MEMGWSSAARTCGARCGSIPSRQPAFSARRRRGSSGPSQPRSGMAVDWQDRSQYADEWSVRAIVPLARNDLEVGHGGRRDRPRPKERSAKGRRRDLPRPKELPGWGTAGEEGRRKTGGESATARDRGRGRGQTGGGDQLEEGRGMDLAGVLAETRQASTAAGEGQGAVRRGENLRRPRPAVVRRRE